MGTTRSRRRSSSSTGSAAVELVAGLAVVALVIGLAVAATAGAEGTTTQGARYQVCRVVSGVDDPACRPPADPGVAPAAAADDGPAYRTALTTTAAPTDATARDGSPVSCTVRTEPGWEKGDEDLDGARNEYMTETGLCVEPDGTVRGCEREHVRYRDGSGRVENQGPMGVGSWTCAPGPAPGVPADEISCERPGEAVASHRCLAGDGAPQQCVAGIGVDGGVDVQHCLPLPVPPATVTYPATTQDCTPERTVALQDVRSCVVDGELYRCSRVDWTAAPIVHWLSSWQCGYDADAVQPADCRRATATSALCAVGDAWVVCVRAASTMHCRQPGAVVDDEFVPDLVVVDPECGTAMSFGAADLAGAGYPPTVPAGAPTPASVAQDLAGLDAELDRMAAMLAVLTGYDVRYPGQAAALQAGLADLNGRMSTQRRPNALSEAQPVVFGPEAPVLVPGHRRTLASRCEVIGENLFIWAVLPAVGSGVLLGLSDRWGDDLSTIGVSGLGTAAVVAPLMTAWNLLKLERDRLSAARGTDVALTEAFRVSVQGLRAAAALAVTQAGEAITGWWNAGGGAPPADTFGDLEAGALRTGLQQLQDAAVAGSALPLAAPPPSPVTAADPR